MEDVAKDAIVDLLLQPAPLASLGSAIVQYAPTSVKAAFFSVVDTVKWLLTDDGEQALDLEVMRALQQGYHPAPSPASSPHEHVPEMLAPRSTSPVHSVSPARRGRRNGGRVHWSPTCELIDLDGEKQLSPLRPSVEARVPREPESLFSNISLFPLVSSH